MPMEEVVGFRVPTEDVEKVNLAAHYRYIELKETGHMKSPSVSEYLRWLVNQDLASIAEEIRKRRSL